MVLVSVVEENLEGGVVIKPGERIVEGIIGELILPRGEACLP